MTPVCGFGDGKTERLKIVGKILTVLFLCVPALFLQAAELDAFENADFEDSAGHGRLDKYTEVARGFGFNGNGGARISKFVRYSFELPVKKTLKLRKGERYVFSLETRNNSKDILEQIALETTNPETGKYEGYWGRKSIDIGGGWFREELAFVPKRDLDAGREKLRFILFVLINPHLKIEAGKSEHYIDCDNAKLKTDEPLWYFCNTWPTHNKIFKERGRVRAYSSFVGRFLNPDAKPVYSFELSTPDGRMLAKASCEEKDGVLTAEFGAVRHEGAAVLTAVLSDRGREVARRRREVTVTETYKPRKGEVFVNERGQTLIDGKPFMPLGFYSDLAKLSKYTKEEVEYHLKRIHEAGFNFLIDYQTYTLKRKEDRDFFYGLCEKYSIKVLADDFAGYQQKPDKLHEIAPQALELAKYPAVLGWYIMDEASEDKIPVLEKIRRALNAVTPGHIVHACNIMSPPPYLPVSDVQGGDNYPISERKDCCLEGADDYMRRAGACRPAAAWHAPQAVNWANYRRGARDDKETYLKSGREPEENEMLSVALAYAANGINGFVFYSYFDIYRGPFPEWYEKRWEKVKKVGAVMKDLEPFITSGRKILEIGRTDKKGRSRVVAMTDGKGDVRVIVYGLSQDNECAFRLPGQFGKMVPVCGNVRREGDLYVYSGKEFTCDILKRGGE